MEKISGIIKSSPRLQSVDMRDSMPVRPGTPTFGRPVGVSSLTDNQVFNQTSVKANGIQNQMSDWRTKDAEKADIARRVSEGFFGKNRREAEVVVDNDAPTFEDVVSSAMYEAPRESTPAGFKAGSVSAFRGTRDFEAEGPGLTQQEETDQLLQPEGLFPKGSFLDRKA